MEHTAQKPSPKVTAIIPARLASTRLEGKLLLPLEGKPLILHTLERAKAARNVSRVIVATDDEKILRVVTESGNEGVLTSKNHQSGSDRIAEVAERLEENSIIVNVQADEPLISPVTIETAVRGMLEDETADIVTTSEAISEIRDVLDPDVVKVITDANGWALYFSRSPIPFPREAFKRFGDLENALGLEKDLLSVYRKHTGLYVYRREFLLKYTKLEQTRLEKLEMLEQLRALENGARIKVVEVSDVSIGVDTREDYERVKRILDTRRRITYRQANAEDAPGIARVHVRSWQKSFAGIAPQEFLDKMSVEKRRRAFEQRFGEANYKMFVAESPGAGIVGFADFGESRDNNFSCETELYAIYLLPEFQRKGIGEQLFRMCLQEIIARGFTSMYLIALEVSPYKSFYQKMGGRIVGEGNHDLAGIEHKTLVYGWDNLREL